MHDPETERWCETCGKTIELGEYIETGGDCFFCEQWWKDHDPDSLLDGVD